MSTELVGVRVECPCPNTPHPDGDTVNLRPHLGLQAGIAIQKLIVEANNVDERLTAADLTGVLAEAYLIYGVASWTFVDDTGQTVPVTRDTIRSRLLDDFSVGAGVADAADDLYMAPLLLPLVKRAAASSPTTPTTKSTSARNGHTPKRRKQSKQSSTSTTQTAVTAEISVSPDGGSKS